MNADDIALVAAAVSSARFAQRKKHTAATNAPFRAPVRRSSPTLSQTNTHSERARSLSPAETLPPAAPEKVVKVEVEDEYMERRMSPPPAPVKRHSSRHSRSPRGPTRNNSSNRRSPRLARQSSACKNKPISVSLDNSGTGKSKRKLILDEEPAGVVVKEEANDDYDMPAGVEANMVMAPEVAPVNEAEAADVLAEVSVLEKPLSPSPPKKLRPSDDNPLNIGDGVDLNCTPVSFNAAHNVPKHSTPIQIKPTIGGPRHSTPVKEVPVQQRFSSVSPRHEAPSQQRIASLSPRREPPTQQQSTCQSHTATQETAPKRPMFSAPASSQRAVDLNVSSGSQRLNTSARSTRSTRSRAAPVATVEVHSKTSLDKMRTHWNELHKEQQVWLGKLRSGGSFSRSSLGKYVLDSFLEIRKVLSNFHGKPAEVAEGVKLFTIGTVQMFELLVVRGVAETATCAAELLHNVLVKFMTTSQHMNEHSRAWLQAKEVLLLVCATVCNVELLMNLKAALLEMQAQFVRTYVGRTGEVDIMFVEYVGRQLDSLTSAIGERMSQRCRAEYYGIL